ncbi:hypothetical protein BDY17DRAFT_243587 [Neohortaea acidophila]|uniref:Vacuolar protein sorting-associated protein 62 n=1 Tax=Neohortaea acidophila TaxID=245834 RepID=A0A6A6Q6F0_9PEZI|nr:uncharacterized protein BDY17DRAFT_243587 [Neohortaea acidophila]KAF2487213.1 hypothetical protein BDY17DRAFT_243587 [Neohortaea acidophila]
MDKENLEWIATSKSWLNRQACLWLGLCGVAHLNSDAWAWDGVQDEIPSPVRPDTSSWWRAGEEDPTSWTPDERAKREIPQYVFDHAPYVHLFSREQFWPGDIAEHLNHTPPYLNYSKISDLEYERNLTNLNDLNRYDSGGYGRFVYLQSADNVEERPRPEWLSGVHNIPQTLQARRKDQDDEEEAEWPEFSDADQLPSQPTFETQTTEDIESVLPSLAPRECKDPFQPVPMPKPDLRKRSAKLRGTKHTPNQLGRSSAPAILVVVPKEDGIVDAFWFFFYSFNLGQKVLGIRFGNHVGDWEHTMIRFRHGKPDQVFLSEHNFGDAFAWHALENNGTAAAGAERPVVYSAVGTHAMYATPGMHPYILPWGILHDQTDRGPLWDPALNAQSYTWDPVKKTIRASTRNPTAPTGWFHFAGHWGDKFYPLSDPRQYRFAGQYHYVNGPTGPRFKSLDRARVCPRQAKKCHIRQWANDGGSRRMPAPGEDAEEGGIPGGNSTDTFKP